MPTGEPVVMQELKLDVSPGSRAELLFDKLHAPVDVVRTEKQGLVTFDFRSFDESLDHESYLVSNDAFSLKQIGEESFDPPLPLLKSPMKTGDSWSWSGKLTSGSTHDAGAKISSKGERLKLSGEAEGEAVRVDVRVEIDGGDKKPSERKLSFWFMKGKGVVRREIASGSIRQPLTPE